MMVFHGQRALHPTCCHPTVEELDPQPPVLSGGSLGWSPVHVQPQLGGSRVACGGGSTWHPEQSWKADGAEQGGKRALPDSEQPADLPRACPTQLLASKGCGTFWGKKESGAKPLAAPGR